MATTVSKKVIKQSSFYKDIDTAVISISTSIESGSPAKIIASVYLIDSKDDTPVQVPPNVKPVLENLPNVIKRRFDIMNIFTTAEDKLALLEANGVNMIVNKLAELLNLTFVSSNE